MYHIFKKTIILVAIGAFLVVPLGSQVLAQEQLYKENPGDGAMMADLVLTRPLGIFSIVAGFSLFCVSAPFSASGQNIKTSWKKMVVAPAKFTFKRPLGASNSLP